MHEVRVYLKKSSDFVTGGFFGLLDTLHSAFFCSRRGVIASISLIAFWLFNGCSCDWWTAAVSSVFPSDVLQIPF
jgi:hypothetical protein